MMSWNYRVVEFIDEIDVVYRQVVEVYYDENGIPNAYCSAGIHMTEDDADDNKDMKTLMLEDVELFRQAISDQPLLKHPNDFIGESMVDEKLLKEVKKQNTNNQHSQQTEVKVNDDDKRKN